MPGTRVEKQLVCSECGQPLVRQPVPTAVVERTTPAADTDDEDDIVADDQEIEVETVIERGPVCPRCAGYR